MPQIQVPKIKEYSTSSRRTFIRNMTIVAGGVNIVPAQLLGGDFSVPSDKISLSFIGEGKQQIDNKILLANLYDKIYDLLTANSQNDPIETGFESSNTRVQMVQGEILNLKDYANAFSSSNLSGDISAAEAISTFVDKVPELSGALWTPKDGLAKVYQEIINNSNTDPDFSPNEKDEILYRRLQGILRAQVEHTSLITGKKTNIIGNSPVYAAYQKAKDEYVNALINAEQVRLDVDFSTNMGKRIAYIDIRKSSNEIKKANRTWVGKGKSNVDEVLAALESIKNKVVSAAIIDAKEHMKETNWFASGEENGQPWMLSSLAPSNWTEPTSKSTALTISSDKLKPSTSEHATTYSKSAKGWFWYGSSGSSGSISTKNVDMVAESFKLSGEMVLVRIRRLWLNQLLFKMNGWSTTDNPISDGKGGGALPGIPIAFVMMRNVSIEAKFNQSASDYIHSLNKSNSISGWGWGPFGGSSRVSNSKLKTDNFKNSGDGMKISFDQPQILAWISTVVPECPPAKK